MMRHKPPALPVKRRDNGPHGLLAMLLASVCAVGLALAAADTRSPTESATPGFDWVHFDDLDARFLKPTHWLASFSQGKLMASLVMQETPASNASPQHARFTVNVVSNLTQTNFRQVSEQVKRFGDDLSRSDQVSVLSRERMRDGPYVGESMLIKRLRSDSVAVMHHRVYLADDRRDWLVILDFYATERDWATLGPVRRTMMSHYQLR